MNNQKLSSALQELLNDILLIHNLRLASKEEKGWHLRLNFGTFWVTDEGVKR